MNHSKKKVTFLHLESVSSFVAGVGGQHVICQVRGQVKPFKIPNLRGKTHQSKLVRFSNGSLIFEEGERKTNALDSNQKDRKSSNIIFSCVLTDKV